MQEFFARNITSSSNSESNTLHSHIKYPWDFWSNAPPLTGGVVPKVTNNFTWLGMRGRSIAPKVPTSSLVCGCLKRGSESLDVKSYKKVENIAFFLRKLLRKFTLWFVVDHVMTQRLCKLITRCRSQRVMRDAVVYKKVRYVACFVDLVSSEHPQMAVQLVITISFLLLLTYGLAEATPIPKPGCKTHCGKVSIPYPFGIGLGCYMDSWFQIVCNGIGAFLKKINMEVLEINFTDTNVWTAGVRVKSSIISSDPSCPSKSSGGGVNIKPFCLLFQNEHVHIGWLQQLGNNSQSRAGGVWV